MAGLGRVLPIDNRQRPGQKPSFDTFPARQVIRAIQSAIDRAAHVRIEFSEHIVRRRLIP
ncbi:MAG: hypothetical protein JWQ50_8148 [Caballeronia mineralivorans]|jgi:hypothetical protein|nr:hypothetical protein [Caballeronia mineralivorans]